MITFEIFPGTKLVINGTKCVAVLDESSVYDTVDACKQCVLLDDPWCDGVICCAHHRQDGKAIHFEKVI